MSAANTFNFQSSNILGKTVTNGKWDVSLYNTERCNVVYTLYTAPDGDGVAIPVHTGDYALTQPEIDGWGADDNIISTYLMTALGLTPMP